MATIAPKIDGATKGDLTGIIRWEVNKKSITTKNSFSTSIEVKGIPWAVGVSKRNNYLSVSFHTLDGDYSVQNVEVKSEYKLINHEDDGKTITRKANYSCEKQMTWGFERFINWKDAVAKDQGFVKDNKLTVQVEFLLSERGVNHGSPPQSVLEEYESEEEQLQYPKRGTGQLSIVEEERSDGDASTNGINESGAPLNFSAEFVDGAEALERIHKYEQIRARENIIIQDDPRFNLSHIPKECSWEPSPYQSRIEEGGDEARIPNQGADSSILRQLDSSKLNRSAASKSAKFAEKKEGSLPRPSSPTESTVSAATSVYVSTPNAQQSQRQLREAVRNRFLDISAIEGTASGPSFSSLVPSAVSPSEHSLNKTYCVEQTGTHKGEEALRALRNEPSGVPSRVPSKQMNMQNTIEEPRRREAKNSSMASSISTASSRSDGMRVESRAESGASNTSATSRTSASGNGRENAIMTNQSVLDFGYVDEGDTKELTFKGRNVLSFPIKCKYAFDKETKLFKFLNEGTIVEPGHTFEVKISFSPDQEDASVGRTVVITATGGSMSIEHSVKLYGTGGSARVLPMEREGLFAHRNTGDFSLHPNHPGLLSLGIQNAGKRSAFIRVVVVDGKGRKVEGINFTPSHSFVILPRGNQKLRLDLTNARVNENDVRCSSSIGTSRGMGSRRSSTASLNSISSSASSATRSSADYTIKLFWGEDTQRVRMVAWCKQQKHSSFPPCCPIDEDFSTPFKNSEAQINHWKKLSKMDCDNFIASLRTTIIAVHLPRRSSQTPMDDDSDMDRTLMSDDTFTGANETMVSMAAHLTQMKARR